MLIFSEDFNNKKFKKIESFEDCKGISADTCVFFEFNDYRKIKEYVGLAKKLQENEIEYAVLLLNVNSFIDSKRNSIFMFNNLGASFFILTGHWQSIQQIANYYLFDMKILYVIDSIYKCDYNLLLEENSYYEDNIFGIDGVIEKSLLGIKKSINY